MLWNNTANKKMNLDRVVGLAVKVQDYLNHFVLHASHQFVLIFFIFTREDKTFSPFPSPRISVPSILLYSFMMWLGNIDFFLSTETAFRFYRCFVCMHFYLMHSLQSLWIKDFIFHLRCLLSNHPHDCLFFLTFLVSLC